MGLKEQFSKITDNWMLIVMFVVGILIVGILLNVSGSSTSSKSMMSLSSSDSYSYNGYTSYNKGYSSDSSLMPNILERIIVKTSSISIQIVNFEESQTQLKSFIKSNDALIINENVNTAFGKYKTGYYTINVPTSKYDSLTSQLKGIGKVNSFNENANDITGSYVNLQEIIAAQKSKLDSYKKLLESTNNVDEKMRLLDNIYSQENNIKSLEHTLSNRKEDVAYSKIQLTLDQDRPAHADIIFATASDLWSSFKASLNIMLYVIAYVLPFAIFATLIWGTTLLFRRK